MGYHVQCTLLLHGAQAPVLHLHGRQYQSSNHFAWRMQAREAYEKALELEPDDKGLQEARHRAHVAEHKAMEVHRHKFKRREPENARMHKPGAAKKLQQAAVIGSAKAAASVTNKSKLSFGEDEESEDA